MKLQYSMKQFKTREDARTWLLDNEFTPAPWLALGRWIATDNEHVEAFKNQNGSWTVARYVAPNPDNYIRN